MLAYRSIYFDDQPVENRILDIFESRTESRGAALFFVHGGGWKGGSRNIFHKIIFQASKRGFECATTDYRLSGVSIFDQVADVRTGIDIFINDLKSREKDVPIILLGSSAGAHLALLSGLASPSECGEPRSPLRHQPRISGIVVQSAPFTFVPWGDIFPPIWASMQKAIGVAYTDRKDRYIQASPVQYVRACAPRMFLLHAENEHMFPREQADEFVTKAEKYSIEIRQKTYPRTEHGFLYALDRWQQKEAFEDILHFIEGG